jgi:uncharacterized protein (DUF1697 family)
MADLLQTYKNLGLRNVKSYIQSGNVLFDADCADPRGVKAELEKHIRSRFGLEVTVIIRDRRELRRIVEKNPFATSGDRDPKRMHVTFMDGSAKAKMPENTPAGPGSGDEFIIAGAEIYLYCPGGYGKTVFSNGFFEKKLKVRATTRNWKTVNELLRIADEGRLPGSPAGGPG